MKQLLLAILCVFILAGKAQNGFTTYTTNIAITGGLRFQTALLIDNSNNKWIGFWTLGTLGNAGLVKYENATGNCKLYNRTSTPAFPSNHVTALAQDNNGIIWIGTDSGLVKFDGLLFTKYTVANGLPSNNIKCIETINNQVYVGTFNGLSRFDGTNFTNYTVVNGGLPDDVITSVKAENSNVIWLGGVSRIVRFNINSTYTSTSYSVCNTSVNAGIINCIYIDSQNTKWLGTTNVGVIMFKDSSFVNITAMYSFQGMIPNKIVDIAKGLNNGVVFKYIHNSTPNVYGFLELAPNNKVYTYIKALTTFTNSSLGDNIESDGNQIAFTITNVLSYQAPNIFYVFDPSAYQTPFGTFSNHNLKNLDINQVSATITSSNYMHGFGYSQSPGYNVPKGSGRFALNGSALWIGGYDTNNLLHGGAQLFSSYKENSFWPGPLDTINTSSIDTLTSRSYDKVWKVSYIDINNFINAFNTGSIIATPDMLTWPAHGSGNNSRNLAPFVDHNSDGLYNPNDGDYPQIKGDQTLYYIFNDKLSVHDTSGIPMGIEIHAMAYAYGCPNVLNGKNELAYTTFYDYKIINRSINNYHDVYVGLWNNSQFGSYNNDYIGCNVVDNYGYIYNQDSIDNAHGYHCGYGVYPPAQGIAIVKGPIANIGDGIDNNNNGNIDENGEDCKLNKFTSFSTNIDAMSTGAPYFLSEYYNYMTGFWRDGFSLYCPGSIATTTTSWLYPGDPNNVGLSTDPNNTCGYWLCDYLDHTGTIVNSGPFTLNAGQMQEVEYAFVTSFDSSSTTNSNLLSVAKLKTDIQKVRAFYALQNKPNCLLSMNVGVTEVLKQTDFSIYPNPTRSIVNITSTIEGKVKIGYEFYDVLGKVVLVNESSNNSFTVNIESLNSGIYFLKLDVNGSIVVKKIVKE